MLAHSSSGINTPSREYNLQFVNISKVELTSRRGRQCWFQCARENETECLEPVIEQATARCKRKEQRAQQSTYYSFVEFGMTMLGVCPLKNAVNGVLPPASNQLIATG